MGQKLSALGRTGVGLPSEVLGESLEKSSSPLRRACFLESWIMSFGFVEHAFWSRGTMLLASQMMLLGYQKSTGWSSKALLLRGLRIGLLAVGAVFLDDIVLVGLLNLQANEQRLGVLLGGGVNLNIRNSSPECRCKVTTSAKRFQIFADFFVQQFSLGVIVVSDRNCRRSALWDAHSFSTLL